MPTGEDQVMATCKLHKILMKFDHVVYEIMQVDRQTNR